jgi:ParB/RepB/Spo0J family partition protein
MIRGNETEDLKDSGETLYLPCSKLMDHPLHFDFYQQSHLEGLVTSIREAGLLEPIVVCPHGDSYKILSGHYRIRAVRRLKWKKVLCRVVKCDDRLSAEIFATSNLLSRGLSAMEEAYMISGLVSEESFTMAEIGKLWGKSKSWVSRRLSLLTHLDPKMRKEMEKGFLNPRVAQELARLPQGNDQARVLMIIKREHLGKDAVAELVSWWLKASENEREMAEKNSISKAKDMIYGSDFLKKNVAKHLSDCIILLTRLIFLLKEEKTFGWWPLDEYHSFKTISTELECVLKEKNFAGEG